MSYSVIYNLISGVSGTVPVDSTLYTSGGTVTVLDASSLTKEGYAFTSWNTVADGSGTSYTPTSTFTITSNINLYATGWLPRVIYNSTNADSGAAPEDVVGYSSGTTITVLGAGTLARVGYSFTTWNTAADGAGTSYTFGSTFVIGDAPVNLYPIWVGTYSITYDGNGNDSGSAPVDAGLYGSDDIVTIAANTGILVKSGYVLKNWNTAADGTGTNYTFNQSTTITSSITLYAVWKLALTVSYSCPDAESGTVPTDETLYTSGGSVVVIGNTGNLVRSGYTFSGWSSNSVTYTAGNTVVITSNTSFVGSWLKNYSVIYNANEATSGSVPIDATIYHTGNSAIILGNTESLAFVNHTFVGWSVNADGSGTVYKSGDSISIGSTDITLYSVFISFTIKYTSTNNTGGTVPVDSNEYASEASVITKLNTGNLSRSGYIFSGWGTSGNVKLYSAGDSFSITENVELFPYWIKSTTYKTYLASGNIVDVCRVGSDIIKVNDSSTKSSIAFNVYNNSISVGSANSLYTSGISGDLFGEMTSTGFASLGSNLNIGISGYLDLTFTTLTNLSVYVVQGDSNNYLFNGTIIASGAAMRIYIPKYILFIAKNVALSFKIEASGSGIAVTNTSALILDRG